MVSSARLLKVRDLCFPPDWRIRHRRRGHFKSPAANPARGPESQIIEGSDDPISDFPVDVAIEKNECVMTFVATTSCGQDMFILDSLSGLVFCQLSTLLQTGGVCWALLMLQQVNPSRDEPRRCSLCCWWTSCRQKSDAVFSEYSGVSAEPSSRQSHWFQIAASPYRTIWRFMCNSFTLKVLWAEPWSKDSVHKKGCVKMQHYSAF